MDAGRAHGPAGAGGHRVAPEGRLHARPPPRVTSEEIDGPAGGGGHPSSRTGPPGTRRARRTFDDVQRRSPKLEVLLAEADPAVLELLLRALREDPLIRVVATATDAEEAVRRAHREADVAVVDASLRGRGGPEVVAALHAVAPRTAILVLTTRRDDELALRFLRRGASGVFPKAAAEAALARLVHAVARGEAVLTRALTMRLVEQVRRTPEVRRGLRPVRSDLSSREWEVLDLLVSGAGTQEIATDLGLAPETVRSHVKNILRKLDAHTRREAVEIARTLVAGTSAPRA